MKHSLKITIILLSMFLFTQIIGIFVAHQYSPKVEEFVDEQGKIITKTTYNLPYGVEPPPTIEEKSTTGLIFSIVIAFAIAVILMFVLMKYSAELLIRIWFFIVSTLAIGITINSIIMNIPFSSIIALAVSIPLTIFKIFKKNILVHNLTELLIYPGIAAIFVSVILSWTNHPIIAIVILFLIISIYDIYAVWHAGFMQKMAQYQIKKLKLFTGFFVPYLGKKEKEMINQLKNSKSKKLKNKKIKVNVAILGGGDVVFPIILAGVALNQLGLVVASLIAICSTIALAFLFYISEKGRFYPAMPFITIGALTGLIIGFLI